MFIIIVIVYVILIQIDFSIVCFACLRNVTDNTYCDIMYVLWLNVAS